MSLKVVTFTILRGFKKRLFKLKTNDFRWQKKLVV